MSSSNAAAIDSTQANASGLTPAVRVESLSHTYPGKGAAASRPALDDVSFAVQPGEMFGILGPNGGGKTTLFRVLCGLLRPTQGQASIAGHDVHDAIAAVRQAVGVVFQQPSLDVQLTAIENLTLQGHLYGLHGRVLRERIDSLLADFGLAERSRDRVAAFSGGMRRRVELAKALLHQPDVLIMDEPSTGLDPGARLDLWRRLRHLRDTRGVTLLLTTHLFEEAEQCDRLAVLAAGKLAGLDTPAGLVGLVGGQVLSLEPKDTTAEGIEAVRAAVASYLAAQGKNPELRVLGDVVQVESPRAAELIGELAPVIGSRVKRMSVAGPSLADAFVHLTGSGFDDDRAVRPDAASPFASGTGGTSSPGGARG